MHYGERTRPVARVQPPAGPHFEMGFREALRPHPACPTRPDGGPEGRNSDSGELCRPPRKSGPQPRLRIGLSAGEPVEQHKTLFGLAINLARRICQMAAPGEILTTGAVRELALGKGFYFEPRAAAPLTELDQSLPLFSIDWRPERPAPLPRVAVPLHSRHSRFWDELTRRRVVRTFGYGIVLFMVLQVGSLTFEPLGLPDWSYTLGPTLGLLGLPIVAVLAWSFDIEGIRRPSDAADPPADSDQSRITLRA